MADVLVSPLAHRAADLASVAASTRGAVTVEEVVALTQFDLRLRPADAGRLPLPVPLEPNTVFASGEVDALWLGLDEWLLVAPSGGPFPVLETALEGVHHSLVDVSANRAVLDLGGDDRRSVLEAGCGIDLHPRAWREGRCAQTLLARVPVILQERAGATRIFVRPSFAGYLASWLIDAVSGR